MPYPEQLVAPMRAELTRLGVQELTTADEVDAAFEQSSSGTVLAIINSVCGCAAANARPAVALVQSVTPQPDRMVTVFAGQDMEATARLREHLAGVPPSSPFMALFKDGDPVWVLERRMIEGRSASAIAADLKAAFEAHAGDGASSDENLIADVGAVATDSPPSTFKSIL
ncbi:MAG: BrxA/BrxB family bacilliredoxin [Thermoanaerobaculia bacterium]|nr:BrxA/BrxB family bacilliredoxin [Thermoanaerobaculia bacterium]